VLLDATPAPVDTEVDFAVKAVEVEVDPVRAYTKRRYLCNLGNEEEISGSGMPQWLADIIGAAGKVRFFKISKKTIVCLIKEEDGWETAVTLSTDTGWNAGTMKYHSLRTALEKVIHEHERIEAEEEIEEATYRSAGDPECADRTFLADVRRSFSARGGVSY
jgi:hypothetical protein